MFSESEESVYDLKEALADARALLGARHKQLQQQWSRSVTLRHVISLLDQIDKVAKVCLLSSEMPLLLRTSLVYMDFSCDMWIDKNTGFLIIPEISHLCNYLYA